MADRDDDGVISEEIVKMKRSRAGHESHFTKFLNNIETLMEDTPNYKEVTDAKEALDKSFENCIKICEEYRDSVTGLERSQEDINEAVYKCEEILGKKATCDRNYGAFLRQCSVTAELTTSASEKSKRSRNSSRRSGSTAKSSVKTSSSLSSASRARMDAKIAQLKARRERERAKLELEIEKSKIKRRVIDAEYAAAEATIIAEEMNEDECSSVKSLAGEQNILENIIEPEDRGATVNMKQFDEPVDDHFIRDETAMHEAMILPKTSMINSPPLAGVRETIAKLSIRSGTAGETKGRLPELRDSPVSRNVYRRELNQNILDPQNSYLNRPVVDLRTNPAVNPERNRVPNYTRRSTSPRRSQLNHFPMSNHLKIDLPEFDENPMRYTQFISEFTAAVHVEQIPANRKLVILLKCTKGIAHDAISACVVEDDWDKGYQDALDILCDRFGQKHMIIKAYLRELTKSPNLRDNNSSDLHKLAGVMRSSYIIFAKWKRMDNLNNSENLSMIYRRLPEDLQIAYLNVTEKIYDKGLEPDFVDLMNFVTRRAKMSNTMYGETLAAERSQRKFKGTKKGDIPRNKVSTFVTDTEIRNKGEPHRESNNKIECLLCGPKFSHKLWKCPKFEKMRPYERTRWVGRKGLCYNCLAGGHLAGNCSIKPHCNKEGCGLNHNVLLHFPLGQKPGGANNFQSSCSGTGTTYSVSGAGDSTVKATTCNIVTERGDNVRLKVLPVAVLDCDEGNVSTYALLDSGSTSCIGTIGLRDELGIEGIETTFTVNTVNGPKEQMGQIIPLIKIKGVDGSLIELKDVLIVDDLPNLKSSIPSERDVKMYPHFNHVEIPEIPDKEIKLIIGASVPEVHDILEVRRGGPGQPHSVKTILGWTLFGNESYTDCDLNVVNFICCDNNLLHRQLCQIYAHDFNESACDFETSMSLEDKRALSIMERTICKKDGHYEIGLPWKSERVKLPNNRVIVERQAYCQKRKFERDYELFERYRAVINDYIGNGYARKIPEKELESSDRTFYLGHHSTTQSKFRVVFNGAGTFRGVSLNENLLQGPDFANNLVGVLLRFRQERVGVMADIRAMFHQVRCRPEDCDSLRFLWWPNDDLSVTPADYQMRVHIFGAKSSPSVASYALRRCATDNDPNVEQEVIDAVLKSFYVDDLVKSVKTTKIAVYLLNQISVLLESGGFHLTKYVSNSREVIASVPEGERAKSLVNLDLDKLPVERALGVYWNTDTDRLVPRVNVKEQPTTRRGLLSTVSQIYDPAGYMQPFILPMKRLMQSLCKQDLGWDEEISESERRTWLDWLENLPLLENFEVPRCFKSEELGDPSEIQMHVFCDASESGYGAVCYLRMLNPDGRIHCSFVMGKSRVSSSKPVTIVRLELSSATVAVKLGVFVKNQLEYKISRVFYWTDSMSVLQYINNTTRRFQTFVANRLAVIHEGSDPTMWRHVDTRNNPADIASRGIKPQQTDKAGIWLNGPAFLRKPEEEWPVSKFIRCIPDCDPELKREPQVYTIQKMENDGPLHRLLIQYSSLDKLQRSMAWILRYCSYLKWKVAKGLGKTCVTPRCGNLTLADIEQATITIVKLVQKECFTSQIEALHDHLSMEDKMVLQPKKVLAKNDQLRSLRQLNPIVVRGILRVGGRIDKSPLPMEIKHPIIMPSEHHVTHLIVDFYHKREGHSGTLHVLSAIRERFWILKGHSTVRRLLRKCFTCRRWNAKVGEQFMADLPFDRVNPSEHAFVHSAVDFFGPLLVKRGRSQEKRYGCLFSCMATRAVHIEMATSLETSRFINALQRFINRRGRPKKIFCDNGTNFVGAARELGDCIRRWNVTQIDKTLQQQGIDWSFSVPLASHTNGAWERMIRSVRKIMRSVVGERLLDDDSLNTVLTQAESILNGRPICPLSDNPEDLETLTPNMLLLGRSNPNLPTDKFMKADGYRKSWRQVQWMTEQFWHRWMKEYLPTLQLRQKWHKPVRNFRVGDLVLLVDEKTKRGFWPKGRIEEVFPDGEGLVRSVRVRTVDSSYMRDIRKLCLLEGVE